MRFFKKPIHVFSVWLLAALIPNFGFADDMAIEEIDTGDENSVALQSSVPAQARNKAPQDYFLSKDTLLVLYPILAERSSLLQEVFKKAVEGCEDTPPSPCGFVDPTPESTILIHSGNSGRQSQSAVYRVFLMSHPQGNGLHVDPVLVIQLRLNTDLDVSNDKLQMKLTLEKVGTDDQWQWIRNGYDEMIEVN